MGVDLTVRAHFAFAKLDHKIIVDLIRRTGYNGIKVVMKEKT
jgi:hypothetical protein